MKRKENACVGRKNERSNAVKELKSSGEKIGKIGTEAIELICVLVLFTGLFVRKKRKERRRMRNVNKMSTLSALE